MKKLFSFVLLGAFALGTIAACSDDNKNNENGNGNGNGNIGTSTETTAEFDESNFGLYKGVIAGSSGTVRIEIHNGNDISEATITMDDETDELTCTETFTKGEAIVEAEFTGEFSSFTFSVGADGSNPTIENITIDGHDNVIATISKETSEDVAVCYEGTSIGGNEHSGVFNLVRNNDTYSGASKAVDGFACTFSGTINNDGSFSGNTSTIFNGLDVDLTYSGAFDGDNVSGTWSNSWVNGEGVPGSNSGTFTGSKTL